MDKGKSQNNDEYLNEDHYGEDDMNDLEADLSDDDEQFNDQYDDFPDDDYIDSDVIEQSDEEFDSGEAHNSTPARKSSLFSFRNIFIVVLILILGVFGISMMGYLGQPETVSPEEVQDGQDMTFGQSTDMSGEESQFPTADEQEMTVDDQSPAPAGGLPQINEDSSVAAEQNIEEQDTGANEPLTPMPSDDDESGAPMFGDNSAQEASPGMDLGAMDEPETEVAQAELGNETGSELPDVSSEETEMVEAEMAAPDQVDTPVDIDEQPPAINEDPAAISQLQGRVDSMESRLDEILDRMDTMNSGVNVQTPGNDSSEQLDRISQQLEQLTSNVSSMQERMNSLEDEQAETADNNASGNQPGSVQMRSITEPALSSSDESEEEQESGQASGPVVQEEDTSPEPATTSRPAPEPEPARPAPPRVSANDWEIRAIQVGKALVARTDTQDMRNIVEGDEVPGLGTISAIDYRNGGWVIEGSQGTLRQ